MNRPIKFRALIEGKWVYYNFLLTADVKRFAEDTDKWTIDKLSQFTGLKDKNGVEIYEGDVVKSQWQHDGVNNYDYEVVGEIKMDEELHQWSIEQDKGSEVFTFPLCSFEREELLEDGLEIIGNVFDNPDLIKI